MTDTPYERMLAWAQRNARRVGPTCLVVVVLATLALGTLWVVAIHGPHLSLIGGAMIAYLVIVGLSVRLAIAAMAQQGPGNHTATAAVAFAASAGAMVLFFVFYLTFGWENGDAMPAAPAPTENAGDLGR